LIHIRKQRSSTVTLSSSSSSLSSYHSCHPAPEPPADALPLLTLGLPPGALLRGEAAGESGRQAEASASDAAGAAVAAAVASRGGGAGCCCCLWGLGGRGLVLPGCCSRAELSGGAVCCCCSETSPGV